MPGKTIMQWAVIGAGPAGIAAVGKLIDHGVHPADILWVDPRFETGDLGHLWQNVSSNTTVARFIDFLRDAKSFSYHLAPENFAINHLPAEQTCILHDIVQPLQWVSDHLCQQVKTVKATITAMDLSERVWKLASAAGEFRAKQVILATGAVPSSLSYPGVDVIAFDTAIDKNKLASTVNKDNTIAVFGSSHSAIIIVRHLVELGVKRVINFYRSPCRYAIDMGDWILFDNTGLKGQTAEWARTHIDGTWPANLERYNTRENHIARYLPECDKVIYAVGFERRNSIIIGDYEQAEHNPHVGIIGPGLFGFGIAYPQLKIDPSGNQEWQVGLWKFMVYLNHVLPLWFKYTT